MHLYYLFSICASNTDVRTQTIKFGVDLVFWQADIVSVLLFKFFIILGL